MNSFITNEIHLLYPKYKTNKHDINKEIYRGELYCNLLKDFTKSCIENLNEKVFSHKKPLNKTITNLLSSWFFTLYQYYDFKDDPFFPTNYNHTKTLFKTFEDYCSLDTIDDHINKINIIISKLINNYNIILIKLNNYIDSSNPIDMYKKIIYQERNNETIAFYKFVISIKHISNNKLNNIINNIILPIKQYDIMKQRYNGNIEDLDTIIWIILYRYQLLSSNNNQLAILQNILDQMKNDFDLSYECFASGINGSLTNYSSIFYDVEKYFGSMGSYYNIVPIKGTFSFNPPYQYDIINNGILQMIKHLDNTQEDLSFIITIPIWDLEGKKYMEDNMMKNNNNIINYEEFIIMNIIKQSKYFKGLRMISKDNFTYFDHNFYLYKNKTIQNTYVIIMSNTNNEMISTINGYDFYTYKD
jgi:hypothetical protein